MADVSRPAHPTYIWSDNDKDAALLKALEKNIIVGDTRRERMSVNIDVCDHFLKQYWVKWDELQKHEELFKIFMFLFAQLEEFFGIRTVLLKGNHRVQASFMWANILNHLVETWVPVHLRVLIESFKVLCDDDDLFKERLNVPADTLLCRIIILPLFDTDLTVTFSRKDNFIKNGSRIEHDIKIFASDCHTRRKPALSSLSGLYAIHGKNLSHSPVWIDTHQFPQLEVIVIKMYEIYFQHLMHDHAQDALGLWDDFFAELWEKNQCEQLGHEIINLNMSDPKCHFGIYETVDKNVERYTWSQLPDDTHENFLDWTDEAKSRAYIDSDFPCPKTLPSHYGCFFMKLLKEMIKSSRAIMFVPNWLKYVGDNWFLPATMRDLFLHAHLSMNDHDLDFKDNSEYIVNLMLKDEKRTARGTWQDLLGNMSDGLAGAMKIATNDSNLNLTMTAHKQAIQNVPADGIGRPMRWWMNCFDDFHRGLISLNRINGKVAKSEYQFFTKGKDMKYILTKNGSLTQQLNFQRMSDVLSRHSNITQLGDLISFTCV